MKDKIYCKAFLEKEVKNLREKLMPLIMKNVSINNEVLSAIEEDKLKPLE